jgi:hypothetical protein
MSYVLRHTGTHEAEEVRVATKSVVLLGGPLVATEDGDELHVARVLPGGSVKFTATRPSAHIGSGYELLVRWRGSNGSLAVAMPAVTPDA